MLIWFLDKSEEEIKIIDLDEKIPISYFVSTFLIVRSKKKVHSKGELLQKSSYYIFWFIAKLW